MKDGWETIQLNNGKASMGKAAGAKKSAGSAAPKIQPVSREKEPPAGLRFEPARSKPATVEERKG